MSAQPMPSSAPRVVPSAEITSPSTFSLIGSFSISIGTPLFFSQTMSMCACRITGAAFAAPFEPAFLITTLPASSVRHFSPRAFANSHRYCVICAVLPLPCGIAQISSKNLKTFFGSIVSII